MASGNSRRIQPRAVDANQTVASAAGLVAGRFSSRRVSLRVISKLDPVWTTGDDDLLREVLVNLLLNGLEATADGGWVRIGVDEKKEWVEIRVADDGPGIPEEMRERLFEPHLTTKPNGTGMGLFTSYGVIREHRGKLLYEGSSQGAVFVVQLPLAPAPLVSQVGIPVKGVHDQAPAHPAPTVR